MDVGKTFGEANRPGGGNSGFGYSISNVAEADGKAVGRWQRGRVKRVGD